MNSNLIEQKNFYSNSILYLLVITVLLHFLKNSFQFYNILLASFIFFTLLFVPTKKFFLNPNTKSFRSIVIFFYISLALVSVWSFFFYNYPLFKGYVGFKDLINGIMRMWIMPCIGIGFFILIYQRSQYKLILKIYVFFVILAALSMLLQHWLGHIPLIGIVGPPRFAGLLPYPSIAGNITIFPAIVGIALILLISKEPYKLNLLNRSILIGLISLGAFLTLQKAAFINLGLGMFIGLFILNLRDIYKYILYTLLLMLFIYLVFPEAYLSILSLIANTTGIEVIDNTIHTGIYEPIYVKFLDRIFAENWRNAPLSALEFFSGFGVIGGADMFGFKFDSQPWRISQIHNPTGFSLGAKHNMFFQLYQIGGIFFVSIFIVILMTNIINLYRVYKKNNDYLAFTLFLCNIVFAINCIVHNGALFHPYISFTFWLSISYLIGPHSFKSLNNQTSNIKNQ